MYEERKKRINWAKIFLVVIIVFLLLLLAVKIITLIRFNNPTKYYSTELDTLHSNARAYFNKDNIPNEIGESSVIYLNQFEEKGIVHEVIPMQNDKCSLEESYIRATRLETEYQVKSYIKCGKFEDSKIEYVSLEETKETTQVTTTTSTTKETSIPKEETTTKSNEEPSRKTTTKRVVTTKKQTTTSTKKQTTTSSNKITIGFNVNGGEQLSSVTVNKGSKIKLPTPVRYGYTFVGWYKNGIHYTSDTTFNDNIILVAKWTKN